MFSFDTHPYFGFYSFKGRNILHVDLSVTASTQKIKLDDLVEMQWHSPVSSCYMFYVI